MPSTGPQPSKKQAPAVSDLASHETYQSSDKPPHLSLPQQPLTIARGKALLLVVLLCVLFFHTSNTGVFLGAQAWTLNNLTDYSHQLLPNTAQRFQHTNTSEAKLPSRAEKYIDTIIKNMTLDEKLGQMMIVQFTGPTDSPDLNTMITHYHIGAVLLFYANGNIVSKPQLKDLIYHMQSDSTLPLTVATDQEGGYVNRLLYLNGPRPSQASIGASNDPGQAQAAGLQDAQDLADYGINLNLAPVVDVDNSPTSELHQDQRTYGTNPERVTSMATAYLQGLQHSGKVIGTLKHFPGLGSVASDPHFAVPLVTRSRSDLERIDWAPYRTLIQQGNVHAIMVTHEIVAAVDDTQPSTISSKVITGILRNDLHFQGVIMTDSLTMKGITNYTLASQVAPLAVAAGADLLMGAASPNTVATMIDGLKQAINATTISPQRIDDSVRRILFMKYTMGLLPIPNNP